MKKNKIIKLLFLIIISLLIIICVYLIRSNFNLKNDYHVIVQDYTRLKTDSREMKNHLIKKDSLQFLSEGYRIDFNLELITSSNKKILLKELLKSNDSLLVIRFSENHCYSCYGIFFTKLKDIYFENKKNIVLITDFKNKRDLRRFIDESDLGLQVYNINQKLDFKIESFEAPYLFMLKSDGYCENFYALDKSHLQIVDQYLENILSR